MSDKLIKAKISVYKYQVKKLKSLHPNTSLSEIIRYIVNGYIRVRTKLDKDKEEKMINKFTEAMQSKFYETAIQKNRSLEPWKEHNLKFLIERLEQEVKELKSATITLV
jgi:hypothetical protein